MVQIIDLVLFYCCEHCFSSKVVFFMTCALLYITVTKTIIRGSWEIFIMQFTCMYFTLSNRNSVFVYGDFFRSENKTGAENS